MIRLLLHWGLKEKVQNVGFKCPRIEFIDGKSTSSFSTLVEILSTYSGKTGDWASALVFHEEVMKELQADAYGMHVRLCRYLKRREKDLSCDISLSIQTCTK